MALRIVIVDYGMGNIQSVRSAFERLGCTVHLADRPEDLETAEALVLPGVGAFGRAMENLNQRGFSDAMRHAVLERHVPLLGICLGMQLLVEHSEERGEHKGLGLIPGEVRTIPVPHGLRLPHIGWNGLTVTQPSPLLKGVKDGDAVYFVHSLMVDCPAEYVIATCDYGMPVTACIAKDRVFGAQFHPERSQRKGLRLLRNFIDTATALKSDASNRAEETPDRMLVDA